MRQAWTRTGDAPGGLPKYIYTGPRCHSPTQDRTPGLPMSRQISVYGGPSRKGDQCCALLVRAEAELNQGVRARVKLHNELAMPTHKYFWKQRSMMRGRDRPGRNYT